MQSSIPSTIQTCRVSQPLLARAWRGRHSTPSLNQCSARAAQDIWEHHRPAVGSSMHALGSVHSASEKRQLRALGGAERPPGAQRTGTPRRPLGLHPRPYQMRAPGYWEAEISLVIGINQTNHSTNQERPCTTVHRIKKELSICPSRLRPDLVTFPVLSQIKPHTPRLVVPFRQFL